MSGHRVWDQTVDEGTWHAWVEQNPHDEYAGSFHLARVNGDGTEHEVIQQTVRIAYGAPFGPDVDDVLTWQNMALEYIDAHNSGE